MTFAACQCREARLVKFPYSFLLIVHIVSGSVTNGAASAGCCFPLRSAAKELTCIRRVAEGWISFLGTRQGTVEHSHSLHHICTSFPQCYLLKVVTKPFDLLINGICYFIIYFKLSRVWIEYVNKRALKHMLRLKNFFLWKKFFCSNFATFSIISSDVLCFCQEKYSRVYTRNYHQELRKQYLFLLLVQTLHMWLSRNFCSLKFESLASAGSLHIQSSCRDDMVPPVVSSLNGCCRNVMG